jgi:hypothetical protein
MKNILFLALLASLLMAGNCKDTVTPPAPPQEGTGDYAPYTLGSTFVYESSGAGMPTEEITLTVSADSMVDGLVYKKLTSNKPTVFPSRFVNYTNGVQREAQFNLNLGGNVVPKLILTNLKINEAVNANWTEPQTFNFSMIPFPITVNFVHTLMAKGATRQVLTTNHTNVIEMKTIGTAVIPAGIMVPPGVVTSFTFNNYYAKGVGLVERINPNQTLKLKSYSIR